MKLRIGKLYNIKWLDASSIDGAWSKIAGLKRQLRAADHTTFWSVGYLIGYSARSIMLCGARDKRCVKDIQTIPRGCILKIRRLK
ncbi:MAG: hypothetical protein WC381_11430 [Kiritimatiellia bacterium]|jgi:hypothetical protein